MVGWGKVWQGKVRNHIHLWLGLVRFGYVWSGMVGQGKESYSFVVWLGKVRCGSVR